ILQLAHTADQIASTFGIPQDIEWAFAGDKLYILQSRPITSLYPVPTRADGKLRFFLNLNPTQGMSGPFTPLAAEAWRLMVDGAVRTHTGRPSPASLLAGRLFIDFTGMMSNKGLQRLLREALARIDIKSQHVVDKLIADQRFPEQNSVKIGTI